MVAATLVGWHRLRRGPLFWSLFVWRLLFLLSRMKWRWSTSHRECDLFYFYGFSACAVALYLFSYGFGDRVGVDFCIGRHIFCDNMDVIKNYICYFSLLFFFFVVYYFPLNIDKRQDNSFRKWVVMCIALRGAPGYRLLKKKRPHPSNTADISRFFLTSFEDRDVGAEGYSYIWCFSCVGVVALGVALTWTFNVSATLGTSAVLIMQNW